MHSSWATPVLGAGCWRGKGGVAGGARQGASRQQAVPPGATPCALMTGGRIEGEEGKGNSRTLKGGEG